MSGKRKTDKRSEEKEKRIEIEKLGYSNTSNPWGDSNLSEKFVWKLKKSSGDDHSKQEEEEEDLLKEVEKVKKRRMERELEKKRWEEEKARLQREKDMQEYKDWEKKEDEFLLKQAKIRAEIRIKEGRAKPIDILYKNLNRDSEFDIPPQLPYVIVDGLSLEELEELKKDIRMYLQLDSHTEFWNSLLTVCDYELQKSRELSDGLHKSVSADVIAILEGKTVKELEVLETQITDKINSGAAVDVEYWESILKHLVVYKAKARLKEIYDQLVADSKVPSSSTSTSLSKLSFGSKAETSLSSSLSSSSSSYRSELKSNDPLEQRRRLLEKEAQKLRLQNALRVEEKALTDDELYRTEAAMDMEEGEELFTTEYPLPAKVYPWQDKYIPKKPKYFNRVQSGYDWNKYNQTHYDEDNPPPKIVEGYRFNIFYADLVDHRTPPQYYLEPSDSPDFLVLRFVAGPPYKEIAFKIVNKEWEYSHKQGFKCTFERGVLRLWFTFKKYRYRR